MQPDYSSVPPGTVVAGGRIFLEDLDSRLCQRADQWFAGLMVAQYAFAIAVAWLVAPTAWSSTASQEVARLFTTIAVGGLATAVPVILAFKRSGSVSNRYAIAGCQMVMCTLIIDQLGGRTEAFFLTHFAMATLTFYRSTRVMLIGSLFAIAGYVYFALSWPASLTGGFPPSRLIEYSAWVALEGAILTLCVQRLRTGWREAADNLTNLEKERHREIEARVQRHEEKRSSDKLREQEQRTATILERAHEAFVAINEQGIITDWNKQSEQVFGWSKQEVLGQTLSETIIPPSMRAAHEQGFQRFLSTGEGKILNRSVEVPALHRLGHEFPIELSVTPVKVGETWTICAFLRDITERTKLMEELALARDKAQEASLLKSQFVANMSHEIRTPMNGILGMSNILLKTALNTQQFECVNAIRQAGLSLLNIINGILDLSKIEAEKIELEHISFSPTDLIEGIGELLVAPAKAKGLSLHTFVDPAIPAELIGDRERLKQILMNLTGNAVKFSEHGQVSVRATIGSQSVHKVVVVFTVSDTGIGISDDEVKTLFQPFVQADGSISRKYGGTGLGLSISKRLVEMMGGEIGVESTKGKGSSFWLKVPLDCPEVTRRALEPRPEILNARTLIIGDDPDAGDVIASYLEAGGLRTDRADTHEQAVEKLVEAIEGDAFQAAIIDLRSPPSESANPGLELGRRILADSRISATRLVFIHDLDDFRSMKEARAAGFGALLARPVKQGQLLEALVEIIAGPPERAGGAGRITEEFAFLAGQMADRRCELVLVADDNPINRQVLEFHLEVMGFSCHTVNNGNEAIEAVAKNTYALVFLDCQMPEIDGLEATRIIRKSEEGAARRVPIVAVTAHAMKGDRDNCLAAGMDDYISKPIDELRLRAVLERWIPMQDVPQERTTDPSQNALSATETPEAKSGASLREPSAQESEVMIARLLDVFGKEKTDRLLEVFVSDCAQALERLQAAVSTGNAGEAAKTAHYLKGACDMMHATTMQELCAQVEASLKKQDWQHIESACRSLARCLDVIRSRIGES